MNRASGARPPFAISALVLLITNTSSSSRLLDPWQSGLEAVGVGFGFDAGIEWRQWELWIDLYLVLEYHLIIRNIVSNNHTCTSHYKLRMNRLAGDSTKLFMIKQTYVLY